MHAQAAHGRCCSVAALIQRPLRRWCLLGCQPYSMHAGCCAGKDMSDMSPGGKRTKRGAGKGRAAQRGREAERRGKV